MSETLPTREELRDRRWETRRRLEHAISAFISTPMAVNFNELTRAALTYQEAWSDCEAEPRGAGT